MRSSRIILTSFALLSAIALQSQTGHVLNDIRTLFGKYDELKKRLWSLQAQITNLDSTHPDEAVSLDSLQEVMTASIHEQLVADSTTLASLRQRLDMIEASVAQRVQTKTESPAMYSQLLAIGAAVLSLLAMILARRRRSALKAHYQPLPARAENIPGSLRERLSESDDAPVDAVSDERVDETGTLSERPSPRIHSQANSPHIPLETLSKRSQIMKELGKKPERSLRKTSSGSIPGNERKRLLTDRASELILRTSRGNLNQSEREQAEQEIAGILREIMELR